MTFHQPVKLTLVMPPAVEPRLIEALLAHEPLLPGFTTLDAEGHGADFARASAHERVRGRVAQRMLLMVLEADALPAVMTLLQREFPNPHIAWWTEQVLNCGRLA